uniref:HD-GYP domain-containing protein n=1 Tax=Candidatus Caldatribacterium saccharofermentans TaxID=1454753 RepID=A0A7V4TEG0_9BACT
MIRVPVSELKPGMKVAYPVLREDGSVLLNRGVVLTEAYIQKLRELGFQSIFVEHELFEDIAASEPLRVETRKRVQRILHDTVRRLRRGGGVSYHEVLQVLEEVLDEILTNSTTVFYLIQMQSRNDLIFHHSVNVAVLSLLVGKCLNLSRLQLRKLGLGALLHDLGKIRLPEDLLVKERNLTEDERNLVRMHPIWSKEMIQRNPDYDFLASVIALQHHERLDGSGYPYGLSGEEIHFLSRICACADVYDALTVDRPYRKRFSYAEALEYLMGNASRLFDLQVVTTMVRHIAPYPVGETVRLTTGEIAVVVRLNEGLPIRPVVRVIRDPNGQPLEKPRDLDLMKELTVAIVGTAEENFESFYTKEDIVSFNIEHLID